MKNNDETAPLSFGEKFGYGLGDAASNFYLAFFGLFLLYYYTDVFGLAPAAVGTMLLITKIVDAVSDPLMGVIADRTDSRWGKYRPYLLWVAIPYGICGYLMFANPDLSQTGKLIYSYATYTLVMLAFTAINVPYSALLGVISPVAEERTKATTFRFFFAAAAGLAVFSLATPLKDALGGGDEALGFKLTMLLFATFSVILFWITFATTKERIAPEHHTTSIRQDIAALFQNESWLLLVATSVIIITGILVRTASIIYYLKYVVGDDGSKLFLIFDKTAIFLTGGSLCQLFGVLLTQVLAARFDKHFVVIAMSLVHAALLVLFFYIPPSNFWPMLAIHGLGLATFGVTITLLFAMYTDCAEYGEWKTDKRTTGLVISASMFSLKLGVAVGAALPGFMLGALGFVANEVQNPETILGIRLMFSILPAVCIFAACFFAYFYRLDRRLLQRVEKEMHERRHS